MAKKVPGTIYFADDTIQTTFLLPTLPLNQGYAFDQIQYKVKYLDSDGKKKTLRPNEALEIRIMDPVGQIRMLARPNTVKPKVAMGTGNMIFLKLVMDGPVNMFIYYYRETESSGSRPSDELEMESDFRGNTTTQELITYTILQKGNAPLMQPPKLGFRKEMMKYFSDCPDLVARLEQKEIKAAQLQEAVQFYNTHCGTSP